MGALLGLLGIWIPQTNGMMRLMMSMTQFTAQATPDRDQSLYEEFTRLAETRLAKHISDYMKIAETTLSNLNFNVLTKTISI